MNKRIQHYFLFLLGLILFSLFIWFRFIRTRLPRDVPFHPRFLGLILLLWICLCYLYAIIMIYKKPSKNSKIWTECNTILFKPLDILDDVIKSILGKAKCDYLLDKFWIKLTTAKRFIITYSLLPRIILVIILGSDVFFYQQLHHIYQIVLLALFPLLARYMKYAVKKSLDNQIKLLSLKAESVWTSYVYGVQPSEWPENIALMTEEEKQENEYDGEETMSLSLDIFINFQSSIMVKGYDPVEYNIRTSDIYREEFKKEFNIEETHLRGGNSLYFKHMHNTLKEKIKHSIDFMVKLQNYYQISNEDKTIKLLRTLIYIGYFSSWFYVLIRSLPHTDWNHVSLSLWNTLNAEINPFTGEEIFKELFLMMIEYYIYDDE